jgi:hypothetical protein
LKTSLSERKREIARSPRSTGLSVQSGARSGNQQRQTQSRTCSGGETSQNGANGIPEFAAAETSIGATTANVWSEKSCVAETACPTGTAVFTQQQSWGFDGERAGELSPEC